MISNTTIFIIVAVIIAIIIIVVLIVYFTIGIGTAPTISGSPQSMFGVQQATISLGQDTLRVVGNVTYFAAPKGGDITLTIPANLNNTIGTLVRVKNYSGSTLSTSGNIKVVGGAGINIDAGGLTSPFTIAPGILATFTVIAKDSYVRT